MGATSTARSRSLAALRRVVQEARVRAELKRVRRLNRRLWRTVLRMKRRSKQHAG